MSASESLPRLEGSVFVLLADLFRRCNARPVLVGGYALNVNKVQRATFDIDFAVTAEECARLEPALVAAGYSVFNRQSAFVQFRSERRGLRDLDLIVCDPVTMGKLAADGLQLRIAGEPFTAASALHLVAMKVHSIAGNRDRESRDLPDIVRLISANRLDPGSDAVKGLFQKRDLMDLHARICRAVGASHG